VFSANALRLQSEWTQVSNNVRPGGNFVVLDLDPASWYHLRVTAHNNAGFSVAEYEFASLTLSGGKSFFFFLANRPTFFLSKTVVRSYRAALQ